MPIQHYGFCFGMPTPSFNVCNSLTKKTGTYYPQYIDLLYQQRAPVQRVRGQTMSAAWQKVSEPKLWGGGRRGEVGGIFAEAVGCQGVWQQLPPPPTLSLTTCTRLRCPCVGAHLTLPRLRCLTPACLFPTFVQMPILFGLPDGLAMNYSGMDAERWPRVSFLNSPNESKEHQAWKPTSHLADPAAWPLSHRRRKPSAVLNEWCLVLLKALPSWQLMKRWS